MAEQLAFTLPARAALGRRDFLVAPPNAEALLAVDAWRDWPGRKLILVGPTGSGKTHLAHVWAADAGARILQAEDIARVLHSPLPAGARLVVEDVDRIDDAETELRLLGLHNLLQETAGWLLMTAGAPPADWPLTLPDLASRVQAAGVARLHQPDDMLLSGVLLKLFDDRQLAIDPAIIAFMAARMERSFAAAADLVAEIDRTALARGRPVTRPLVSEILARSGNSAPQ